MTVEAQKRMRSTFLENLKGRTVSALFVAVLEFPAQEPINLMESMAQSSHHTQCDV